MGQLRFFLLPLPLLLPMLMLHMLPRLPLLLSAPQTARISFPANEPVTLFAPNNKAFDAEDEDGEPRNLQKYTGLTLEQLFLPVNRHKLVQVCVSSPCAAVHAPCTAVNAPRTACALHLQDLWSAGLDAAALGCSRKLSRCPAGAADDAGTEDPAHDSQACTRVLHAQAKQLRQTLLQSQQDRPAADCALLHAASHPLQLVKYHIVPSCIGYYSTFRPSMPPVLVVNSAANVGAASSTAVIASGEQATQFSTTSALQPGLSQLVVQDRSSVQVSTPAAAYPTRQVAPNQARSWAQPGSYKTYTVTKPGHTYVQGKVRLLKEGLHSIAAHAVLQHI
jgi:hypothetical protein